MCWKGVCWSKHVCNSAILPSHWRHTGADRDTVRPVTRHCTINMSYTTLLWISIFFVATLFWLSSGWVFATKTLGQGLEKIMFGLKIPVFSTDTTGCWRCMTHASIYTVVDNAGIWKVVVLMVYLGGAGGCTVKLVISSHWHRRSVSVPPWVSDWEVIGPQRLVK